MNTYLTILLEDIRKAYRDQPHQSTQPDSIDEMFSEVDLFVSGDAEQPLAYYCQLNSDDFPPANQLSDEEMLQICRAMEEMLETWNAMVDMPSEVPAGMRYELMVSLLQNGFTPMSYGNYVFDFCSGYAEECELKEYCTCRD